jgi:hypothetical protein
MTHLIFLVGVLYCLFRISSCQWVYDVAAVRRFCTSRRGWCHELTRQVRCRLVFHRFIQVWKADLVERGCFIYLDSNLSTHESSCSDSIYLAVRGTTPGPLFVWADGSSFTALQVNSYLCILLSRMGIPGNFSSYSFCSGAATAAAEAALPVPLIPRSWTLGKRCVSPWYSHFTRYSFAGDGGFIRDWRLLLGKVSPMVTFLQPL